MRKIILFSPFFFCQMCLVSAQSEKYFIKNFGDNTYIEQCMSIKQTKDSGYIMTGNKGRMGEESAKALIVCTDKSGNRKWEKIYGDTNLFWTNFHDIIKVEEDAYICAGAWEKQKGSIWRSYVVMIDTLGEVLWERVIGDPDSLISNYSRSVQQTYNGGFILAGLALDSAGYYDAAIFMLDSLGNMVWDTVMGQNGQHEGFGQVIQLPDSSFAIVGNYDFLIDQNSAWFVRLDNKRKVIFDYKYNVNGKNPGFSSIGITQDNGFVISGDDGYNIPGIYRPTLYKMNSLGVIQWYYIIKNFNNPYYSGLAKMAYQLDDNGFILCGNIDVGPSDNRDALLSRLDSNGNELWRRTYGIYPGRHEYAYDMVPTSDGGYVMTGRAETPTDADVLLIKTNCDGFTGPPKAILQKTINYNEVYFTNRSDSSIKYKWLFGDGDSLLYNYDKSWKYIWGYDRPDTLTHVYPDSGTYILKLIAYACDESDTLIDTLHVSLPVGIDKSKSYSNVSVPFTIFSVPGGNELMVNTLNGADFHTAELRVHDVTGRMVRKYMLSGNSGTYFLSTEGLKQGVYVFGLYRNGRFAGARKGVVW